MENIDEPKPVGKLKPYYAQKPTDIKPVGELKPYNPNEKTKSNYESYLSGQTPFNQQANQRTPDEIIDSLGELPGNSDSKKSVLKDYVKTRPKTEDISDAILTMQGKNPKQKGGLKYYLREDGKPIPIANDEDVPEGYSISKLWGNKKEAKDDNFITDILKHAYNIAPNLGEDVVDLAQTVYGGITGDKSENLQSLKNAANYLKMETDEDLEGGVFNKIKKFEDISWENLDLSPEKIWGTSLQLGQILGEIAIPAGMAAKGVKGAKWAYKVGDDGIKQLTTAGKWATAGASSAFINQGELADAADRAGLDPRERFAFVTTVTPLMTALDVQGGLGGKVSEIIAAKSINKEVTDNLLTEAAKKLLVKNADGTIAKESVNAALKDIAANYPKTIKGLLQETLKTNTKESLTEIGQDIVQKTGQQLFDQINGQEKFGTDAFSEESIVDYLGTGVNTFLGSIPASGATSYSELNQKENIRIENEKSKNLYEVVKKGDVAVKNFKLNIQRELEDGELSESQANDALTKINAYDKYNKEIDPLKIKDEEKREIFDLTFQKENLISKLNVIGKKDELGAIGLGIYNGIEAQAKDIQKRIDELILKAQIKDEVVVPEKTMEDVSEEDTAGEQEQPKETNIEDTAQFDELLSKFKDISKKDESRAYEEITNEEFNGDEILARDKQRILFDFINKQPSSKIDGNIVSRGVKWKGNNNNVEKNSVFGAKLKDGKIIRFSSSVKRGDKYGRGNLEVSAWFPKSLRKENPDGSWSVDEEKFENAPIGVKAVTIQNDVEGGPDKKAIKIFYKGEGADYGKFLGWAKETQRGSSKYVGEEVIQLEDEEKIIEPLDGEETINQITPPVKPNELIDTATGVYVVPISELSTDTNRFQNRDELDADIVKNISENFDDNQFDPIVVWRDNGKTFVLAGHHRLEGAKQASKTNVKVRFFEGNEKEAIEFAKEKSNANRTMENPVERAKIYREKAKRGDSKKTIEEEAKKNEGKNASFYLNIAALNENGVAIQTYNSFKNSADVAAQKEVQKILDWIGEVRRSYPELTNQHEQELFDFIFKGDAKRITTKAEFKQKVSSIVGTIDFDPSKPLNIARFKNKTEGEQLYEKEIEELKTEINKRQDKITEIKDRFINPKNPDYIKQYSKDYTSAKKIADDKIADLNLEQKKLQSDLYKLQQKKDDYVNAGSNQGALFQKKSSTQKSRVDKIVKHIQRVLPKVKVVYDENLEAAGKLKGNTITINPYYAGNDTPIHEAAHILLDAMGENKVVKAAIGQLRNTDLWKEVEGRYPNLNEKQLENEVLAEAIGREGANIFDTASERSKFKAYLDYIFDWFKQKLGLDKSIAKSLAKQIISGIGTKNLDGLSDKEVKNQITSTQKSTVKKKPKNFTNFREQVLGRNVKSIKQDLAKLNDLLANKTLSKEKKQMVQEAINGIQYQFLQDKKAYNKFKEDFAEINNINNAENLDKFSIKDLTDAWNVLRQIGDYQTEKFKDVKRKIAERIYKEQTDVLKKNPLYQEGKKRDMTWREVWIETLSDKKQDFPLIQALSNYYEQAVLDKSREIRKRKEKLEKLAKAVIKEKNKSLGSVSDWFTSDSAKYFDYIDDNGKLRKNTDGLTDAQKEYLAYITELHNEKNDSLDDEYVTDAVVKLDKGFREKLRTEGVKAAVLGLFKKSEPQNEVSLNYNGRLSSKYKAEKKGEEKTSYSKDFYRAGQALIEDIAHVKYMNDIVPIVDSIEQFYTELGFNQKEGEKRLDYSNTLKFLKEWKDEQLYEKEKITDENLDAALKFLRKFTSLTVMGFNVPANIMNVFMGNYNSWRKEGLWNWSVGQARLFGGGERAAYGAVSKKAMDILKDYDVVNLDVNSNPKTSVSNFISNLAFAGQTWGEYQIQGSMFLGQLTETEWNSFEKNKDGEWVLKKDVNKKEFDAKMQEYKKRVADVQGKYASKDRRNFMRFEAGKSIAQFKLWIPDFIKERFGEEYIDRAGKLQKGSYRMLSKEAFNELRNEVKSKGFTKAMWENERMMSNLKGLATLGFLLLMTKSGDDEDEKKKKREVLSLENGLSNLLFVIDPQQSKYLLASPSAGVGKVINAIDVIESALDNDYEKSRYNAKKLIPGNKIFDVPKQLGMEK